jgi:hypothetical protein
LGRTIKTLAFAAVGIGLAAVVPLFGRITSPFSQAEAGNCSAYTTDFADYVVVYPGEEVDGHELIRCQRPKHHTKYEINGQTVVDETSDFIWLAYGDKEACKPQADAAAFEEACPNYPVQIFIDPPCGSSLLDESRKKEKVKVRNVEAFVKPDASLRIETKSFRVTVYAEIDQVEEAEIVATSRPEEIEEKIFKAKRDEAIKIAEQLRGANDLASELKVEDEFGKKLKKDKVCA